MTSQAPYVCTTAKVLSRRTFLRGTGVALALPALECMTPVFGRPAPTPRRLLVIVNNIGVLAKHFFPAGTGSGYEMSPYLSVLADHRADFTIFSGLSHPGVSGGHSTDNCFLTSARGAFKANFRNTISLDQLAAEQIGQATRFPSFNLGVNIEKANRSLSWTRDGVLLPAEDNPGAIFRRMFVAGDQAAVEARLQRLETRGSILDTLLSESQRFSRRVGRADRTRLDQYQTSIREVELRLQAAREWERRPKPTTTRPEPAAIEGDKFFFEKFALLLEIAQLAFESDSTRIVTLMLDAFKTPIFRLSGDQNTTDGYHGLSHHGFEEARVRQLEAADRQGMATLRRLLDSLAQKPEDGERLLDRTMVLFGSNMGDSNIHDNTNLPILLAGGGFRHGQHLAFNPRNNAPLSNLFVSILQRLGVETDSFGSSTGALAGLGMA